MNENNIEKATPLSANEFACLKNNPLRDNDLMYRTKTAFSTVFCFTATETVTEEIIENIVGSEKTETEEFGDISM